MLWSHDPDRKSRSWPWALCIKQQYYSQHSDAAGVWIRENNSIKKVAKQLMSTTKDILPKVIDLTHNHR